RLAQLVVVLADDDSDALSKKPALQVGASPELATIGSLLAVEPDRERHAVGEGDRNRVRCQGGLEFRQSHKRFRVRAGEERIEVGLMRGSRDDTDGLAG